MGDCLAGHKMEWSDVQASCGWGEHSWEADLAYQPARVDVARRFLARFWKEGLRILEGTQLRLERSRVTRAELWEVLGDVDDDYI